MNKALVIIDVDDIVLQAQDMSIKLFKSEAKEIFDNIDTSDWNCESSTFNSFVQERIRIYSTERDVES